MVLSEILTQNITAMKTFNSEGYLAPEFEVTDVMTERGFAETNLEDPDINPPQDWN